MKKVLCVHILPLLPKAKGTNYDGDDATKKMSQDKRAQSMSIRPLNIKLHENSVMDGLEICHLISPWMGQMRKKVSDACKVKGNKNPSHACI